MTLAALALAAQVTLAPCPIEGGAFLDRGSADGLDRTCAAANPAPPFVLSGAGQ